MNGYESEAASIFERMSTLADPGRSRILRVLEMHELSVGEVCAVFQLPQSTASRQLKTLSEAGWLVARAQGPSRWYRMAPGRVQGTSGRLWTLVREQLAGTPAAVEDERRTAAVLAERRTRSQEFFSSAAGEWDHVRGELFGSRGPQLALLGLLDPRWTVGDLGCGTGVTAHALAPFVRRVVAVDESPAMLAAARTRLGSASNVEVRQGELGRLPLADGKLDAAVLSLVLHHVPEPREALVEVARSLRPGGKLLVIDMARHDREEYRQSMGHLWLGISAKELREWTREAGFSDFRHVALPPDPEAKGPALFAASAGKP